MLPVVHRAEPTLALQQQATITLAARHRLDRADRRAVLAIAWAAALHTDPSVARRVVLVARHEKIADDLGAGGAGSSIRERLNHLVETELQVAALAAGL